MVLVLGTSSVNWFLRSMSFRILHVSLLEGYCTVLEFFVDMVSLTQALSTTDVGIVFYVVLYFQCQHHA